MWFHDLPPPATIHGAIVATDTGTTRVGMAMALVYEHVPGWYTAVAASGVGTSQEGEALTLLLCAHRLALQQGVYWVVPDSESAVCTLQIYQEGGQCGERMHHLYHALPLDNCHQHTGGCGDQGGATSGPHRDDVPPLRLLAPGKVPGPLLASPCGHASVVARVGGDPLSGTL